jgi:hypothetical protein
MLIIRNNIAFMCACLLHLIAAGSTGAETQKDVLIFAKGEKLIGHLERSNGPTVYFKSDTLGEICVDWSKIKELHTAGQFAVAEKGVKFGRHEYTGKIPQGRLTMTDQTLTVASTPASPTAIPVSDAQYVIGQAAFQRALRRPNFFEDWQGSARFGTSLVAATQNNRAFTSAIALTRTIPVQRWMHPENRTILVFSSSYGKLTQPGAPDVKTSIYHAEAERDEYFTRRLYTFAEATFDHNYSLGLDLQQIYGAGLGWSVVESRTDSFDLKAELANINQAFLNPPRISTWSVPLSARAIITRLSTESYSTNSSRLLPPGATQTPILQPET